MYGENETISRGVATAGGEVTPPPLIENIDLEKLWRYFFLKRLGKNLEKAPRFEITKIAPGISSANLLYSEFQLLKDDIDNSTELSELINKPKPIDNGYSNATRIYRFLLTLPITVASNERSFSQLKLLKIYINQ